MPRTAALTVGRVALACLLIVAALLGGRSTHAARPRADASTLTIGWAVDSKTMDPALSGTNEEIWIFVNIYDQLIRVDNQNKTLQPDLATSWEISKDGTVYTFHLRPNVRFHDGTLLTAGDVKFCLERAAAPTSTWSWTLTALKKVEAPDPATVRVTLKHRWAPFLSDLALFDTGVYPAAYFKKVGAGGLGQHPIGSGPYMLESWRHGQYLRIAKNPRYWRAADYALQHIEFQLIPNDTTRLLKVQAGELDVDAGLAYNLIGQVRGSATAGVHFSPSTKIVYIVPNHKVAPFGDARVRQAINHGIDRAALIKAVLGGYGTAANSFLPKGAIAYDPSIPVPSHDISLARKLLAQSSVPHGFRMTMEVQAGDITYNQIAVIFQQQMAALGIAVTLKPTDPTVMYDSQKGETFHIIPTFWTNDIPDPDELVSYAIDYTQDTKAFFTQYNNPEIIALVHRAQLATDEASRIRAYHRIQEIYAREVPFWSLYYTPFINAVSNKVQHFAENPLGYFIFSGMRKA